MFDPASKEHRGKLRRAIEACDKRIQKFRENRVEMIRQLVGSHNADGGASQPVPVNLVELAASTVSQALVSGQPQVLIETPFSQLRHTAALFEMGVNKLAVRINVQRALQRIVYDAMFGIGIAKTGLFNAGTVDVDGTILPVVQPYVDVVSIDDYVFDTAARRLDRVAWEGDRMRLSLDEIASAGIYDREAIGKLRPTDRREQQNRFSSKAEEVSKDSAIEDEELDPYVDLIDVYFPRLNLVCTLAAGDSMEDVPPLRVEKWDGIETGPYHKLVYTEIPDNPLPLPPAAVWRDMHTLVNRLYRKLARQAERAKTVIGFRGEGEQDARRIRDAVDGDYVLMDDPKNVGSFSFEGVDPKIMAFMMQSNDLFNRHAGNLDALGGLGAMSDTVGQDELMVGNASKRIQSMQAATELVARDIMQSVAYDIWTDPVMDIPLTRHVPGTNVQVQTRFSPEIRTGDFYDFNFTLSTYSLQQLTPQQRLNGLLMLLERVIMPAGRMMQAQGMGIDWDETIRRLAKYSHLSDDVAAIVKFVGMSAADAVGPQGASEAPGMPAVTRRENVRINRPAGTRQGRDAAMMQTLLGAGVQNGDMAALARGGA